jgi:hypothetical protein
LPQAQGASQHACLNGFHLAYFLLLITPQWSYSEMTGKSISAPYNSPLRIAGKIREMLPTKYPTLAMTARFQLSAFSAQRQNISIVISVVSYNKTSLQNAKKSRIKNLYPMS